MYTLGLSFYYHDSAACLVRDGQVIAAAQEERFSRKKHDASFPAESIRYCLESAGITSDQLDSVIFYEKPFLKFDRILTTHFKSWPRAWMPFIRMQEAWLGGKLRIPSLIRNRLGYSGPVLFCRHHEAHAASAFYGSPFRSAAVVTIDGVGEWATASISRAEGNSIRPIQEIRFPHSLGLFYSAITSYLGFEVNEDEYKVMGLAPYGRPTYLESLRRLLRLHEDGSFELDMGYFAFESEERMLDEKKASALFGFPARAKNTPITREHQYLAASAQALLEEAVVRLCERAVDITSESRVCLSGGVALNCLANSRVLGHPKIDDLYVFPAAGDAGSAVGAALYGYYRLSGENRTHQELPTIYLGPDYSQGEIDAYLERAGIPHRKLTDAELFSETARLIHEQRIIGWFQGRMEFGPRALGNRSILADPTRAENWPRVNRKIKFREDFRPLAPSILEEACGEYFESVERSPYMLLTARNKTGRLPAVTHVDGSSRLQTVSREQNPRYHALISAFRERSGVPVLLNTSFNTAGMPIVESPQNAFQCFAESDLDALVLGNSLILRERIPYLAEKRPCS